MQIAGFLATAQRVAPYVAVWLVVVVVVALTPLNGVWRSADYTFLQSVLHLGAGVVPDRDLAIVDLDVNATASGADLRVREIGILDALNAVAGYRPLAAGGPACERAAIHRGPKREVENERELLPSAIVFDVAFTLSTSRLEPGCVAPLVTELRQLRKLGVRIYAAQELESANGGGSITGRLEIDPNFEANQDERIYAQISRSGHTLISADPYVPVGQIFLYPKVLRIPAAAGAMGTTASCALPIVATGRADDVCLPLLSHDDERESDTEIVTVGTSAAFHARAIKYGAAVRDVAALQTKTVVIGDEAIDTAAGDPRSKFEILCWAVSQTIADLRGRPLPRVLIDSTVMVALAVFSAIIALAAFLSARTLLRRRRGQLALATLAGLALPLAILAVIDASLAAHEQLYSQLGLPVAIVFATVGVSLWAAIVTAKRDLFVTQLQTRETSVPEKYDVFISYARTAENTKWVEDNVLAPLSKVRDANGRPLRIFFDRQTIKIGYTWYTTLVEGVYGSRYFVPIYSEGYFDRPFCRDELDMAMLRQVGADAFILPVARVTNEIPTQYGRVQFIDANLNPAFIDAIIATISAPEAVGSA